MAANGRPWFVFYDPAAVGVAHFGTFMVPYQPSNEAEELTMQATPWLYREFPTRAAAQKWITSPEGKNIRTEMGKTPGGAGNAITGGIGGLSQIAGIIGRLGQRNLWLRVVKIIAGVALIIIGAVQLTHASRVITTATQAAAVIA